MSAVRYLFDEDFNGKIIRGLRRRAPELDTLTVREAGIGAALDPAVLEWSARESRLLVSHDHNTMRFYAEERLSAELPMPGLLLISQDYPLGQAIEDLALIGQATSTEEWQGLILFLPL